MSRLERLLNLAAALSNTGRPLTFDEIRERVPGYTDGAPGRRAFERDKEQLRQLGFGLTAQQVPDGQFGYRLRPEDWSIGDLDLLPEEAAALAVAPSVARLEGGETLAGIVGPGPEIARAAFSTRLPPPGALHDSLMDAIAQRRRVRFHYARGESGERDVEALGLVLRNGRWYLVGHDTTRGAARAFRVDRISGDVQVSDPHSFERPPDFDPETLVPTGAGAYGEQTTTVRLRLDGSVAWWAVPQLGRYEIVEEVADGALVVDVEVSVIEAFVGFAASLLEAAEILDPPGVRQALVDHVRGAIAEWNGGAQP